MQSWRVTPATYSDILRVNRACLRGVPGFGPLMTDRYHPPGSCQPKCLRSSGHTPSKPQVDGLWSPSAWKPARKGWNPYHSHLPHRSCFIQKKTDCKDHLHGGKSRQELTLRTGAASSPCRWKRTGADVPGDRCWLRTCKPRAPATSDTAAVPFPDRWSWPSRGWSPGLEATNLTFNKLIDLKQ